MSFWRVPYHWTPSLSAFTLFAASLTEDECVLRSCKRSCAGRTKEPGSPVWHQSLAPIRRPAQCHRGNSSNPSNRHSKNPAWAPTRPTVPCRTLHTPFLHLVNPVRPLQSPPPTPLVLFSPTQIRLRVLLRPQATLLPGLPLPHPHARTLPNLHFQLPKVLLLGSLALVMYLTPVHTLMEVIGTLWALICPLLSHLQAGHFIGQGLVYHSRTPEPQCFSFSHSLSQCLLIPCLSSISFFFPLLPPTETEICGLHTPKFSLPVWGLHKMFDIGSPCPPPSFADTSVKDLLQKTWQRPKWTSLNFGLGSVPGCSSMLPELRFQILDCADWISHFFVRLI